MSYKRLGEYIIENVEFNEGNKYDLLQGVSNNKYFQKAKTNTIGVDLSKYRVAHHNQFVFNRATTRNGDKISIALRKGESCIVSPSYRIFEVQDENILNPDYLLMWFRRPEFDRYARFKSHGSAHEFFDMGEMEDVELPIPSIEKQKEIVDQYQAVENKIKVNEQICEKLEATAQALYKHWFVDFEFPVIARNEAISSPLGYKSSGGKMVFNQELEKEIPEGWEVKSLGEICEKIASGSTPSGGKENYKDFGISLIRSMNIYDLEFIYNDLAFIDEDQSKKLSNVIVKTNDILFNITGVSVARCTIVPENILPARVNQHVMIIRPKMGSCLNFYTLLNLISSESKNTLLGISQSGSTREAITKTEIENFRVLMPKLNILIHFEKVVSNMFEYKNSLNIQNQNLTQFQSLLLSRLARLEEK